MLMYPMEVKKYQPLTQKRIVWPELSFKGSSRRGLDRSLAGYRQDDWWRAARAFEANPNSFYNAWRYLNEHPIYWRLQDWKLPEGEIPAWAWQNVASTGAFVNGGIWVHVGRVNPADGKISHDGALNTRTEVWLETGEWSWPDEENKQEDHYHNFKIDCCAKTFEEAVINMAVAVHRAYGNDRRKCAPQYHDRKHAKAEARLQASSKNWHAGYESPYSHPCAYGKRAKKGLAGIMERMDAPQEGKA